MKRLFVLVLSLLMLLSLFAGCGGSGSEQGGKDIAGQFSVGYGAADISPEKSVYLRGYGEPKNERMSTGVAERLYATCVSIQDASGNQALLISLDLLGADRAAIQPLREQIAEKYSIPFENIMVCCSHNHSGPDMSDTVYRALMTERTLEAV